MLALWNLRSPLDLSLGDQAQYLLHARAMLAGRAYTDDSYIFYAPAGVSPAAYPPGVPVLIALIELLGGSMLVVRLAMIAAATGFLYLAGRYLSQIDEEWAGPATIFICGLVPPLARFSTGIYSDFVFAGLVWACCLLVDRPGEWRAGRVASLAVVGALALAVRTVAVALIPALIVHQAWRTYRHRDKWTRSIAPLFVWTATYLAIDHEFPSTAGYMEQITRAIASDRAHSVVVAVARLFAARALEYRELISAIQLSPTPWPVVNAVYHVAALVACAVGVVVWVRRAGIRYLYCFSAFYVGVLLLMPWPAARFLWPLLPGIWFATLEGARFIAQRVTGDARLALRASVVMGCLTAVVGATVGREPRRLVGVSEVREGRELYRTLESMAARSPMRIAYFNPRDAARVNGVSAMALPDLAPDSLLDTLASYHITHVVAGSVGPDPRGTDALQRAIAQRGESFERLFANDSFAIFRIRPVSGTMTGAGHAQGTH